MTGLWGEERIADELSLKLGMSGTASSERIQVRDLRRDR